MVQKFILALWLISTLTLTPAHAVDARLIARLEIPGIALDTAPVAVGLDDGYPVVTYNDVDWWQDSAAPGAGGNVVFWGHYLQSNGRAGPFYRLRDVQLGDELIVTTDVARAYVVRYIHLYDNHTVEYMLPTTWERLTLITCAGRVVWTAFGWKYPYRLVVMATPKNED